MNPDIKTIITREWVEQALAYNEHVKYFPMNGLTRGEYVRLVNKIVYDMALCREKNGEEFLVRIWQIISRRLATANLSHPKGVYFIWNGTYRQASRKVQQDLEALKVKPIQQAVGAAVRSVTAAMDQALVGKGMR